MKRKFWKIFATVIAATIILCVLAGVLLINLFRHSKEFVSFDGNKLTEVYSALTVLDDDGQQIDEPLYIDDRKQIPLSALHDYTYMAFVAVEDKRFFQHSGIDYKRVAGATLHNLKSRSYKEGASTISQQLIKNTHLDNSKTLKRKLNEMMLTAELERKYSKKEILEMYVNTIYFGRNAYGIESAANVYFNKSSADLTLSESEILAGMIKAPNVYAPDKNAEKCKARRDTVLKFMLEQQLVDFDSYAAALNEPISYCPQTVQKEKNYVYMVMREACRLLNMTPLQLAKSGFVIETYCNGKLQEELRTLVSEDKTLNKKGGLSDMSAIVLNNDGGVQACLLRGETAGTKRQAGSTLKPVAVYAPALNEKIITQASPVLDEETDFNGYKPTNSGGYNGWTTIKYAVAKSLNVPAVKTLNALTLPVSESYLAKMGIKGKQNLSLALGNAEGGIDFLDLARCYGTLANDGVCNDVGFIKKIYCGDGLIYSRESQSQRVFKSGANYLMSDMLVNTVENGTAKQLKNKNYSVAAKTGTVGNAQGNSDALVAGYTTENTFVVWYSGDLPNNVNGSAAPSAFADKLLKKLYATHAPKDFSPPSTVVRIDVDKENLYANQLVTKCENGEKFWFDKANQPKSVAEKTVYDYTIEAKIVGDEVNLTLPKTEGIWQLYRKTDKTEKLPLSGNVYSERISGDACYYAELYVKDKLVFTAPCVTVHFVENAPVPRDEMPDLTDFWYWG